MVSGRRSKSAPASVCAADELAFARERERERAANNA